MAVGQQFPEQYTVPQYARIFHSLPHLNVSLHSVNNTFNPHSEIYLEVGSLARRESVDPSLASDYRGTIPLGCHLQPPWRARIDLPDLKQSASD